MAINRYLYKNVYDVYDVYSPFYRIKKLYFLKQQYID